MIILACIKALYTFIHIVIGLYDFSFYRIPNILLGAIIVLYGFYAPLYLDMTTFLSSLAICGGMLAMGFALFSFKLIGAGDAKYLAVASLWMGTHGIVYFLLIVSLVGGGLGILYLSLPDYMARLSDRTWSKIQNAEERYSYLECMWVGSGTGPEKKMRATIGSRTIPYGVAIAAGAIITVLYII
ncbi:MAG: prepilin peptidase [Proteobacteria bacterium]|nr:prepilin peptidase [Pseudomonadota bacterium]